MGRRLIEVAELLVDHVHKAGYQHRVLEDSIHAESQKRIAAEKDRDHWRQARQEAIAAGELMQAEIESLRKQLADAQREASDEFVERQVLTAEQDQDAEIWRQQVADAQAEAIEARRQRNEQTDRLNATNAVSVQQRDEIAYLRARLDEERSISADLQQQLDVSRKETAEVRRRNSELVKERDAALAAVSLQRAEIERLNTCLAKIRQHVAEMDQQEDLLCVLVDIRSALAELESNSSATLTGSPEPEVGK